MENVALDLRIRYADCLEKLVADTSPPWRELSPKQLADLTGITVQSLANWRYRSNGPRFTQRPRSRACRYRPCDILEWLTGVPAQKFIRDWLFTHGLIPDDASDEHVEWVASLYQQSR
ncbi:hypothetical protein AB9K41_08360 [Cribrihabitans sp. XS_ASV171]